MHILRNQSNVLNKTMLNTENKLHNNSILNISNDPNNIYQKEENNSEVSNFTFQSKNDLKISKFQKFRPPSLNLKREEEAIDFFNQHSTTKARQSPFDAFLTPVVSPETLCWENSEKYSSLQISHYKNSYFKKLEDNAINLFPHEILLPQSQRNEYIEWMIYLCFHLHISTRLLCTAVTFLDRAFSSFDFSDLPNREIYLYVTACISLACKMDSSTSIKASDYISFPETNCSLEKFSQIERDLFKKLDFILLSTTVCHYLQPWINDNQGSYEMHLVSQFCSLCCLFNPWFSSNSTELSAAAIFIVAFNALHYNWVFSPVLEIIKKYGPSEISKTTQKVVSAITSIVSQSKSLLHKFYNSSLQKNIIHLDYQPISE